MNASRFHGPGSTATRRAFWDALYDEVNAVQKVQGDNIDIDVYPQGSVINVDDRAGAATGTPACVFTATLVCDSISASKTNCFGFIGLDLDLDPRTHYLTRVHIQECTTFAEDDPPETNFTFTQTGTCSEEDCSFSYVYDCPGVASPPCDAGIETRCPFDGSGENHGISDTDYVGAGFEIHLSNEVGADPCAGAIANLPAYDNDFNDDCFASRDLSEDGTSCTIQNFRYKFTFPAATIQCTLNWIERFTPDVGSVVDTPMSEIISVGQTESSVHEVIAPATDGVITIVYPV